MLDVAIFAIENDLFALAQNHVPGDIKIAFQASSPKNFNGPAGNGRAFFHPRSSGPQSRHCPRLFRARQRMSYSRRLQSSDAVPSLLMMIGARSST